MTSLQSFRLDRGGRIDRSRLISFSFNGRELTGYQGDTVASALLANGIRIVNRSFKFHRPRGILSAGVEEPNALLAIDSGDGFVPLVRATITPLQDGMKVQSQTGFPGIEFDLLRIFDYTRSLWSAGFYNKTFKWPSWHLYEKPIRAMAGLGRLPEQPGSTLFAHGNIHCDLMVVGAGPSGLAAALEAAREGQDVLLVEQDREAGGCMLQSEFHLENKNSSGWLQQNLEAIAAIPNIRCMFHTTAVGYYDHNVVTLHERSGEAGKTLERFWKVRASRVVLATGAIEQPLMFGNNDLPGIMLSGAMQTYAHRYAVLCGRKIVALVNNDLAWNSLFSIQDSGAEVSAIIDLRADTDQQLMAVARQRKITVHAGAIPLSASGSKQVGGLHFLDASGARQHLACDAIAMSGGFNPTIHLYSQAGGKLQYHDELACFVPKECSQAVRVVGAASGAFAEPGKYSIARQRRPAPTGTGSQWVDFLHDVTVADLELAVRENFTSVEHLKRYTTTGMAVDQGKTSNLNALSVLGQLTEKVPGAVGTTTFRPQFMPVTMGAIAGHKQADLYSPTRYLPAHDWHVEHVAVFDDYGGWKRPACYGTDRAAAIRQEVLQVRQSVGLFDGSPLGKIEVMGPDAAIFLERIYMNSVQNLQPGRVRYGLILNEIGVVIDDGVFVRLGPGHFLLNTTSGNADRIAAWLEEWHQCEWPDLEVIIAPVTSQWAVVAVAGPKARHVLAALPGMVDLANANFPHMSFHSGTFSNRTPYRVQRVSYSGELGYEVNIPADCATEFMQHIAEAGEPFGIRPFGIEAMLVLRLEKGFLHVGVDTDGTTNPLDLGFGRVTANQAGDFIGARSLQRASDLRPDRRQLVGFELPADSGFVMAGGHFVSEAGKPLRSEGFVTSACLSPSLEKVIGLGLLERGFQRKGEIVRILDNGVEVQAKIVSPCFYDPSGERMRA